MNTEHAIVEEKGHTLVITLNRPEKRNALSPGMLVTVYEAWRKLDKDSNLRCAVLTGAGGTFCSGADLSAMKDGNEDSQMMEKLKTIPDLHWQALLRHNRPNKPIIAAVEGFALAGGTEILQGTDVRVAGKSAVFGLTELMSITVAPVLIFFKKSGFFITSSTAISSVNIVIITSQLLTTSFIDFEISAPNFLNGSAFSIDLLNTLSLNPDFNKFFAIGKPMRPVPIKPIFFIYHFLGTNS